MKLEDIGFYTLSDERAKHTSIYSSLKRCELILTDRCNFKCKYCRGLRSDCQGSMSFETANRVLDYWLADDIVNIRFSGGEPTLFPGLVDLVNRCKKNGVERIALSTNGSASIQLYNELLDAGVNDFSISLDGGCCSIGDDMSGVANSWNKVVETIQHLSALTYVTVGMVFTEDNVNDCVESVMFADSLGVSDVRVIPAAQYNQALNKLQSLPDTVLNKYPILKYRIGNMVRDRHVRGIGESDCHHCWLMLDDMAIAGEWHFPCIIYLREGGEPVGKIGPNMRQERLDWVLDHNCYNDPICQRMCLDVCVDYNNKAGQSPKVREESKYYADCKREGSRETANVA